MPWNARTLCLFSGRPFGAVLYNRLRVNCFIPFHREISVANSVETRRPRDTLSLVEAAIDLFQIASANATADAVRSANETGVSSRSSARMASGILSLVVAALTANPCSLSNKWFDSQDRVASAKAFWISRPACPFCPRAKAISASRSRTRMRLETAFASMCRRSASAI